MSQRICLDPHLDIPPFYASDAFDVDDPRQNASLTRREAGGHHAALLAAYVPQLERTEANDKIVWDLAQAKFDAVDRLVQTAAPARVAKATTAEDFESIVASGKLAVACSVENGFSMGTDLSRLETMKARGVIAFGFTHNGHNALADSAIARPNLGDAQTEHGGLSQLGREALAELNRLQILPDVAHASPQAVLDICKYSTRPVIASHTGAAALANSPRNLNDEAMKAIAATRGVVHLMALGWYLEYDEEKMAALKVIRERLAKEFDAAHPDLDKSWFVLEINKPKNFAEIESRWPRPGIERLMQHLEHAIRVVGIDHVGLSSDFDGGGGIVGWDDASETQNVTKALEDRGFSETEIQKIWSGNFLRALRETQG